MAKENERDLLLNKRTRDALDKRNIVLTVAEALRRYASEVSEFLKFDIHTRKFLIVMTD
ncbi:hypothetical protein GCM10023206_29690 [Acinetobacter puyangensis]|uniref:hypothetical protein n=1 Tax=Acinetobacter puyangensis TaxID=1096779 RepID=UPI00148B4A38|nr:hypothetical protein [Acinetobacter puyangensis]